MMRLICDNVRMSFADDFIHIVGYANTHMYGRRMLPLQQKVPMSNGREVIGNVVQDFLSHDISQDEIAMACSHNATDSVRFVCAAFGVNNISHIERIAVHVKAIVHENDLLLRLMRGTRKNEVIVCDFDPVVLSTCIYPLELSKSIFSHVDIGREFVSQADEA